MNSAFLTTVRIVLVEPAGARNIGSIARIMKNMGLSQLVLVNPQCNPHGDEARQMAVHAADILESAHIVPDLPTALTGCHRAIATTGRPRTQATQLEHPRTALPWLLPTPDSPHHHSALIFGREDRGLENPELTYAHRFITIPSNPLYPSLNLAQAVAICCYELSQLPHTPTPHTPHPTPPHPTPPPAPLDRLEPFFHQLTTLLLDIGYLYPHTVESRMQKLRRLFSRAMPSEPEIAMLRGILSQVRWAIQQQPKNQIKD